MNGVYASGGQGTPVQLCYPTTFRFLRPSGAVQHATVLALDMSSSMYQSGLFFEAKKTAMALDSLIRGQFPRDALYVIGFANVAFELNREPVAAAAGKRLCPGHELRRWRYRWLSNSSAATVEAIVKFYLLLTASRPRVGCPTADCTLTIRRAASSATPRWPRPLAALGTTSRSIRLLWTQTPGW